MASLKRSSPLILIILLAFTLTTTVSKVKLVHGAILSPSQCMEERRVSVSACKPIIFGQPPSPACCARIRVNHFDCVCPAITPKLAALIDVNRAIKILKTCGRKVPRHFKCGGLHFP